MVLQQQRSFASDSTVKPYVSGESTHFGFEEVNVQEKERKVREVFDNVADSYDIMNDVMSAGIHRLWKDYLLDVSRVEELAKVARASDIDFKILDVAGGTGDGTYLYTMSDAIRCLVFGLMHTTF